MHVDVAMMAAWAAVPAVGYVVGRLLIARDKRRMTARVDRSPVRVPVTPPTTSVTAPSSWT